MGDNVKKRSVDRTRRGSRLLAAGLLFVCSLLGGVLIGWLAFLLGIAGFRPIVLFSLVVGAACGGCAAGLALAFGVVRHRMILTAAACAALVAVGSQHVHAYRHYLVLFEAARQGRPVDAGADAAELQAGNALMQPRTASEFFFDQEPRTHVWWAVDGLLTTAAAMLTGLLFTRQPICDACRTRMTCIRRGAIEGESLRRVIGLLWPGRSIDAHTALFRLWSCPNCGRQRFLQLDVRDHDDEVHDLDTLVAENVEAEVTALLARDTRKGQS